MEKWVESIYSDGLSPFVSSPAPKLGETVKIRVRMYEEAPVKRVILWFVRNGAENIELMRAVKTEKGLKYFEAEVKLTETRLQYHFNILTENSVYYYTQRGVTTFMPNKDYDFVLLTDYVQPAWVKEAVFYQIFPERFYNGDPTNDVKTGEYSVYGHPSLKIEDWNAEPLPFEKGFCMDFYGGDLNGITKKIPYLKKLGVTALYINPIFRAPSVHKYDCVDYLEVDPHFGGDEALAELSKALHDNGMKLIIDISINHTGTEHKWFNRDGLWFDRSIGAYNNPDSVERGYYFFYENNAYRGWMNLPGLPTLNYTSESLRDAIYRAEDCVLKKWLKPPYSIDGWRFDVADVFARQDELQLSHEVWPEIRRSIREENPQAYILAEDWGDCAEHLRGDEWDAPMNYYGCGRPIRQFLGEPERFMGLHGLWEGINYKMTAEDVESLVLDYLGKQPQAIRDNQFNLIDSHDISRLHNNPKVDREEYRGAVIFQFTLPGAPSIYYGDEAEVGGTIDTNEGCRWPMPWDKEIEATDNYKLYSTLAKAKREHPALSHGGMKFLHARDYVIALARFTEDDAVVSVLSTSDKDEKISLPLRAIGAIEPEGGEDFFGNSIQYEKSEDGSITLTVPAHRAYMFRCE